MTTPVATQVVAAASFLWSGRGRPRDGLRGGARRRIACGHCRTGIFGAGTTAPAPAFAPCLSGRRRGRCRCGCRRGGYRFGADLLGRFRRSGFAGRSRGGVGAGTTTPAAAAFARRLFGGWLWGSHRVCRRRGCGYRFRSGLLHGFHRRGGERSFALCRRRGVEAGTAMAAAAPPAVLLFAVRRSPGLFLVRGLGVSRRLRLSFCCGRRFDGRRLPGHRLIRSTVGILRDDRHEPDGSTWQVTVKRERKARPRNSGPFRLARRGGGRDRREPLKMVTMSALWRPPNPSFRTWGPSNSFPFLRVIVLLQIKRIADRHPARLMEGKMRIRAETQSLVDQKTEGAAVPRVIDDRLEHPRRHQAASRKDIPRPASDSAC